MSVGMDVGSTTVKTVVLDEDDTIVWSAYDRHETRQAEVLLSQLRTVQDELRGHGFRFFITGSGSGSIAPVIGATFVQEVNAIEVAAERLYPDTGAVVELGGQDAKIIVWKSNGSDERRSVITMNDKCAGGTGATIDRILFKAGVSAQDAVGIPWDPRVVHPIAAKCGVFAETDVVGLLKSGISRTEIVPSLFHAITQQNLEVLTRGNVLRDRVLLLGGPNRFFPQLVECWRSQIARHWQERRYTPEHGDLEVAIHCPENAELFAAYGAVLFGNLELAHVGRDGVEEEDGVTDRCPLEALEAYIRTDRVDMLSRSGRSRPPLVRDEAEKQAFLEKYATAAFTPRALSPGETVRAYLGIDGGSTSTKAVLLDESGDIIDQSYVLSSGNPLEDAKTIFAEIEDRARSQGATLEVLGAGATGYASRLLKETFCLDTAIVETVAHMLSAQREYDDVDVICDVGGQDIKLIFLQDGRIKDYRFNTQCCAGNGYFLQSIASQFNIPLDEFADRAFQARIAPSFHYGCVVFMEQDKVHLQQLGWSPEEMLAGLAQVLPMNIWQYIAREPNIARFGRRFVLQGGTQRNLAAVKAQVDYIRERIPDAEVFVHRHASVAGAIGAALEAQRVVRQRGSSSFIGISGVMSIEHETRNDQTTRCSFCSNHCPRTFITTVAPGGRRTLFVSGYACEKGSATDLAEMRAIEQQTRSRLDSSVNLVDEAATTLFAQYDAAPPSVARRPVANGVLNGLLDRLVATRRPAGAAEVRRDEITVGIPRALTLYHSAPFFSTFFRALGVRDVVFSDVTSDKLWERGSRWGTIDPCFPAKVANAHVHDLLTRKKVNAVFFPMVECFESHLVGTRGSTACTIQTATPEVVHASFTKERDYFAEAGVEYWKPLVNLQRRLECAAALYEYFAPRLGVTQDEVERAVQAGYEALDQYRQNLRRKGRAVIEAAVRQGDVVIVAIGRTYHNDPGINHGILRKFQLRGYPVIPVDAIPIDDDFLAPLFSDGKSDSSPEEMRGVLDVWKRAYNYGANHKLWAAKVVARHPNLVGISFSCFKCGYDYSISGYLENIASAARSPYFAFHDLDQKKSEAALDLRIESICYFLDQMRDGMRREPSRHPGQLWSPAAPPDARGSIEALGTPSDVASFGGRPCLHSATCGASSLTDGGMS
jgi:activator of 2-hydroxyglutaryl-CoA dehydratase/predicted nucleotide-binding protein (sugar kinase/HSP70/actin superfamily)